MGMGMPGMMPGMGMGGGVLGVLMGMLGGGRMMGAGSLMPPSPKMPPLLPPAANFSDQQSIQQTPNVTINNGNSGRELPTHEMNSMSMQAVPPWLEGDNNLVGSSYSGYKRGSFALDKPH